MEQRTSFNYYALDTYSYYIILGLLLIIKATNERTRPGERDVCLFQSRFPLQVEVRAVIVRDHIVNLNWKGVNQRPVHELIDLSVQLIRGESPFYFFYLDCLYHSDTA